MHSYWLELVIWLATSNRSVLFQNYWTLKFVYDISCLIPFGPIILCYIKLLNVWHHSCSFQILMAMQRELANSGMSQEEILAKMMLLQKAMAGDNSPAFINKTIRNALLAANISPDELSKVRPWCQQTHWGNSQEWSRLILITFTLGKLQTRLKN